MCGHIEFSWRGVRHMLAVIGGILLIPSLAAIGFTGYLFF